MIASQSLDLMPTSISEDDEGITIDWGGHRSTYSRAWYDEITSQVERHHLSPAHWNPDLPLPRFRHGDLNQATGSGRAAVSDFVTSFARHGAVVIQGVPSYSGESERFISRWAPIRELPFGRVHDVRIDPSGYNIAHTFEGLPPHSDFASYAWPPSGQGLHMLVNDAVGGDSIVVDGIAIAAQLTDDERDVLSTFPVPFRQFDASVGHETWTKAPLFRLAPDGSITGLRFSNQLMQPLDPQAHDLMRFYRAFHRFSSLLLDEANQHRFRLESGDMLVVHGHRMLHGRSEYRPSTGARHLQDVYFEYEDMINQLHVLGGSPALTA